MRPPCWALLRIVGCLAALLCSIEGLAALFCSTEGLPALQPAISLAACILALSITVRPSLLCPNHLLQVRETFQFAARCMSSGYKQGEPTAGGVAADPLLRAHLAVAPTTTVFPGWSPSGRATLLPGLRLPRPACTPCTSACT